MAMNQTTTEQQNTRTNIIYVCTMICIFVCMHAYGYNGSDCIALNITEVIALNACAEALELSKTTEI